MASVNTTSIREEIARIERDLTLLAGNRKLSDESRVLFNSLLMIVNMLVAIFIEKSIRNTSKEFRKCKVGAVSNAGTVKRVPCVQFGIEGHQILTLFAPAGSVLCYLRGALAHQGIR